MKNQLILIALFSLIACSPENNGQPSGGNPSAPDSDWLIPKNLVFDGGPGKDGIPAMTDPDMIPVGQVDYLADDDLIIGFSYNGEVRAYPHPILDWHEIINDSPGGLPVAITYCPLTGTGIAWDRELDGKVTTFGVSGLLYNTNLIPYDRLTDSNWVQIGLMCVNGKLKGQTIKTYHLIETTWKTWKEMYPQSTVVSTNTGFSRRYGRYPYGDYKTNDDKLLFPVEIKDDRLPAKERVLAVVIDEAIMAYRFFPAKDQTVILHDRFMNTDLGVVSNDEKNFIAAFENDFGGGKRNFTVLQSPEKDKVFGDDLGNIYDLFGEVKEGPDKGKSLPRVTSFMAYWFSLRPFYESVDVHGKI